ncbi:MAG: DUF4397 domain-containing protein, partial [Acidimicrobiia bacterium]|nr:DUF4397 domain-containing protein [Acidimicrobiia bacterium]
TGSIELAPGANLTAIAHLSEAGDPTLSVFANDDSQIVGENTRLTVRHTAEAPSVDVWANGGVLIEDFTNPDSVTVEVPAGSYGVALSLPNMTDVIFDAGTLDLAAGTHYIVYAFGTFPDTFDLLIQVIDGLAPATGYGVASVVHGVPGLTVDVYLNGQLAIEDFEPWTIAGPLLLPAIAYDIAIYPADADPLADAPAITGYAELPAGANVSIAAYLDTTPGLLGALATPAISVFVNDVSETSDQDARLTVRHLADAPNVDVRANGGALFSDVANGESGSADVWAGDYAVDLTLPGDSTPVFDAGTLSLAAGTSYTVYAVGTFPDTFELLIQTIDGLSPDGAFADDDGSVHEGAVNALAAADIVLGKSDGSFGANDLITRGQLASIIARSLGLASSVDAFSDDDGSVHEDAINALAAYGITQGRADGTFGPNDRISRAQSASFIARTLALSGGADAFADDDGSVHEDAINALAAAGIAQGKADGTFGPMDNLSRGQMASLWARALGLAS